MNKVIYDKEIDREFYIDELLTEEYAVLREVLWRMLQRNYPYEIVERNIKLYQAIEYADPIPKELYDICQEYINNNLECIGISDIDCWRD